MKLVCLVLILLFFFIHELSGQKNIIHINAGKYRAISYERIVSTDSLANSNKFTLEIHGGKVSQLFYASDDSYDWTHIGVNGNLLVGKHKSFFEIALGGGVVFEKLYKQGIRENPQHNTFPLIDIHIAWRYLHEKIAFRFGVGFPRGFFVSLGWRF